MAISREDLVETLRAQGDDRDMFLSLLDLPPEDLFKFVDLETDEEPPIFCQNDPNFTARFPHGWKSRLELTQAGLELALCLYSMVGPTRRRQEAAQRRSCQDLMSQASHGKNREG